MSQTAYNVNMGVAQYGQLADSRVRTVESYTALEAIDFGRAVAISNDPDKPNTVRLPRRTRGKLVLSADLVASNVVNGSVNGEAISAVTYATSHDNTMDLLIAALEALDVIKRAELATDDSDNRTILLEIIDADVSLTSWAVTLGGSQATIATSVSGASERIAGIALFDHTRPNPGTGDAAYAANDTVNVLSQGAVWVGCVDVPSLDVPLTESTDVAPNITGVIIGGTDKGKLCGNPPPGGATTRVIPNAAYRQIIDNGDDTAAACLIINLPGTAI